MIKECSKGFTLIETLFVLSAFLTISFFALVYVKPQAAVMDRQAFFTQLKSDLYFAQQYAISHQKEVTVNILPDTYMYYVRHQSGGPIIISRNYSRSITVLGGSMPLYFHYTPSGEISKFGSIYILFGEENYKMTFQIGKGRFYVAKQ